MSNLNRIHKYKYITCPICGKDKDIITVLCWACYHEIAHKLNKDYTMRDYIKEHGKYAHKDYTH